MNRKVGKHVGKHVDRNGDRHFFPQRLRMGLLSLSAQACNVGIAIFRPPLSTGPLLLLLVLLLFLQSKGFVDQGGSNVRQAYSR